MTTAQDRIKPAQGPYVAPAQFLPPIIDFPIIMATTTTTRPMMPFNPAGFAAPYYLNQQGYAPAGWPGMYMRPPMYRHPSSFSSFLPPPSSSTELVLRNAPPPEPEASSRALVRVTPIARDTPSTYPAPPLDDEQNPPVPIHPYLYYDGCPITWDVRTNLRHNARRQDGERLSSIALKAVATNDPEGPNKTVMRIVCCDESFPWTIVVRRESGITVTDVFMEIGQGLDIEMTDPEKAIANQYRVAAAEEHRKANEGTGAVKIRPKDDGMRRVDWLGTRTTFRGLVHSSAKEFEALVHKKVHAHDRPNTWIMILQERPLAIEDGNAE